MEKMQAFMERFFVPFAAKINSQRHVAAVRDAFTLSFPLTMAGSMVLLINYVFLDPTGFVASLLHLGDLIPNLADYQAVLSSVINGTTNILAILIAFLVAYQLAQEMQGDQVLCGITALAAYFILYPAARNFADKSGSGLMTTYFGAQGLFVALFVGLFVAELLTRLGNNKKLVIKMPEQVPPAVSQSFNLLLPIMIVLAVTGVLNFIFNNITSDGIQVLIYNMIQAPLTSLGSSMGTIIVFVVVIHGPNTLNALRSVIFTEQQNMNLAYVAAHGTAWGAPYPINWGSINDAFGNTGGSGATLGLIIATFIVGKKNKAQYQICKMSLAPGLFNINEPIIFGLPMVLNPLMMIPFIFVPVINSIIAYGLMAFHIVGKGIIETPWTTPAPLGAALGCMDFKAAIMVICLIILDTVLYYPFFKLLEKQKLEEENSVQTN